MKRFMHLSKTKKLVAAGLAVGIALGTAGAAFAYFTTTGAGNGNATVGTSTAWDVTTGTPTFTGDTALTPQPSSCISSLTGCVYETIPYTVANNSSGTQNLANVAISVANNDGSPWTAVAGCSASDFSIDGAAVGAKANDASLAGEVAAGTSVSGSLTIAMIDNGQVQDGCKNATVPVYLFAS